MKPFVEGTAKPDGGRSRIFHNGKYVAIRTPGEDTYGNPIMVLSVRREDRRAIMDWRDMQWIKNQLLGEETEAVQLFPAESRLVDTANQYYLYAYNREPQFRFPFGFEDRLVTEKTSIRTAGHSGSQQRPFANHVAPPDLEEQENKMLSLMRDIGAV